MDRKVLLALGCIVVLIVFMQVFTYDESFVYQGSAPSCHFNVPNATGPLRNPGTGYCGYVGVGLNVGSGVGSPTGARTPAECADVCEQRNGCNGYKISGTDCYPLALPDATTVQASLLRHNADPGWSIGFRTEG